MGRKPVGEPGQIGHRRRHGGAGGSAGQPHRRYTRTAECPLVTGQITQDALGDLTGDERTLGRAGIATVRLTGAAAGSAMAAGANLAGFADGFWAQAARTAGVWVFAAALPMAGGLDYRLAPGLAGVNASTTQ